jgi:hypothetical protein
MQICNWTREEYDFPTFSTACGELFEFNGDGHPHQAFKFCCFCGKPMTRRAAGGNGESAPTPPNTQSAAIAQIAARIEDRVVCNELLTLSLRTFASEQVQQLRALSNVTTGS